VRYLGLGTGLSLLAIAATTSCGSAVSLPCSHSAAGAAIARTKPRLNVGENLVVTPEQAERVLCFDATGDGHTDMAVSVASGGSAGDVGWLLFRPKGGRWRLAGSGTGYQLEIFRSNSDLEVVQPVFRAKDPNCCPTGGFDWALYRWNGKRLVVAKTWHAKRFR
jgi:hypothetical protein